MIGFVGLSLLVLLANAAVAAGTVQTWYTAQAQPAWAAPFWLFRPIWTVVYPVAGVAAWLVWRRIDIGVERKRAALRLWGWQMLLGAFWPPVFFGLHSPGPGLLALAPLGVVAALTIRAFRPLQRAGAALMLPCAAWIAYAACLDAGFWWLNRV